jgi:hypothetical protein
MPVPPPSTTEPSAVAVGLDKPADATNATTAPTMLGCTAFPVSWLGQQATDVGKCNGKEGIGERVEVSGEQFSVSEEGCQVH